MKNMLKRLCGTVRAEISGASPEAVLNAAALNALELWDMDCENAYTLRVTVYEKQFKELERLAQRCMCSVRLTAVSGGSRIKKLLHRRRFLAIFLALAAAVQLLSSLFLWNIEISGCEKVSRGEVLRALKDCGVTIGAYWPGIKPDIVRSKMLLRLPELGWMSVNISASEARVVISERREKPEIYDPDTPQDIIASKTGIISKISVTNGKCLVKPGQAVTEGELLVTGVMDSITNEPRTVCARSEILARTWSDNTAACPSEQSYKIKSGSRRNKFAIIFGGERVNLYFGSGNTIDGCDKIIHQYKLAVTGLFTLPVTVVREEYIRYDSELRAFSDIEGLEQRLTQRLDEAVDGSIVTASFTRRENDGILFVTLTAECLENIALSKEIAGGASPP